MNDKTRREWFCRRVDLRLSRLTACQHPWRTAGPHRLRLVACRRVRGDYTGKSFRSSSGDGRLPYSHTWKASA